MNKNIQPPHNNDAETGVLSTLLLTDAAPQIFSGLTDEDFYKAGHKVIFQAAQALFSKGVTPDLVTVTEQLTSSGKLREAGGIEALALLTEMIPSRAMAPQYMRIIKDKSKARKIIRIASDLVAKTYQDGSAEFAIDSFATEFGKLNVSGKQGPERIDLAVDRAMQMAKDIQDGKIVRVPTGFCDLDSMLNGGLAAKDLVVLAARPSMGKTALAMQIADRAARDRMVYVVSLEMGNEQLMLRRMSSVGKISGTAIQQGNLNDASWPNMSRAAGYLKKLNMVLDDSCSGRLNEMIARIKAQAMQEHVGLVVIDYLQLMAANAENRTREIGEITRELKMLAKTLDAPVLLLSQLNRGLEQRTEKRPQMSDLRESGSIEQDADVIMFIYRDDYYNRNEDNPLRGQAEVAVAKHRNGPTGTVHLQWEARYAEFNNIFRG